MLQCGRVPDHRVMVFCLMDGGVLSTPGAVHPACACALLNRVATSQGSRAKALCQLGELQKCSARENKPPGEVYFLYRGLGEGGSVLGIFCLEMLMTTAAPLL